MFVSFGYSCVCLSSLVFVCVWSPAGAPCQECLRGPRIDRNVGLAACLLNAEWKTVVFELIAKCRAMQQIQAAWVCVQIKSNYSCAGPNTKAELPTTNLVNYVFVW